MVVPLGQRAADDLANIMTHSAERWSQLPIDQRPNFAKEMLAKHQLMIKPADQSLPESTSFLPYLYFLKQAIKKHQNSEVQLKNSIDKQGVEWFWTDILITDQNVRIGFERNRIGVQPPLALLLVLLAGLFLTLITTVVLTRRLTVPIEKLYLAAHDIGKGHWPDPIEEEGPEELVTLVKTFNRMNKQVKELLSNRTTLLAGIAHDLRTPLTQIQLALEMLPHDGGDKALMDSIKDDLERINNLISQSLRIGIEFNEEEKEKVDLAKELEGIINNYKQDNISINWLRHEPCLTTIHTLSFKRIISNLLDNSIRYGESQPITLSYQDKKDTITIKIQDGGPGIPENQLENIFRPFYRLEQSHCTDTSGSGLGLAIVRQLSDSHGWSVTLKKRNTKGTTAIVIIPKMRDIPTL